MNKDIVIFENEYGDTIEYEMIDALTFDDRLYIALYTQREPMEILIVEGIEKDEKIYVECIENDFLLDRLAGIFNQRIPVYRKKTEILTRQRMEENKYE